ncbi:MAG: N-acyl-D-amino-acid deacylase family protein [Acidimicrobiales bacterium]
MEADLVIRNGLVVDGTGSAPEVADVVVQGERVVEVGRGADARGRREIDAEGMVVTPGFVNVHTPLDAQLAWDPAASSSCYHGITTVVIGNCGVTFAPVGPGQREFLAEMMESVEDIPRGAILEGLSWDWTSYGDYLCWLDELPKGPNVGGMVGHCAVRVAAMGERALDQAVASEDDLEVMCQMVNEAMDAGALGFSTSRTTLHRVPGGRNVPSTWAEAEELLAIGDVLGRAGRGVFEGAMRLGERDGDDLAKTRAELSWMGEMSRRSGRPVSFGLTQSDRRPSLWSDVLAMCKEQNARGATLRPQTTARAVGVLFGLHNRTPFAYGSALWKDLQELPLQMRLEALRNPEQRGALVREANASPPPIPPELLWILPPGDARYDLAPEDTLAARASREGVSAVEAFIDHALETDGKGLLNFPFLNQRLDDVEAMLDDPLVPLRLADAGTHVGQIMDSSQPTFFLTYWVRERERWPLEEAVRRLTSDTADLFGITGRGRLVPGAFADLNVIDWGALRLPQPEFVHYFPCGAGRYVQRASGYRHTFVNGVEFMTDGEPTGHLAGVTLRPGG